MKSYNDALQIIKDEINNLSLQTEVVSIEESSNRVLAEDIIADIDLPPFDNSAMDGFAIRFSARRNWKIVGEISAGHYDSINLNHDEAVLITTGSKIPINSDTVIPLEDVLVERENLKLVKDVRVKRGMNIRLKGNDLSKGSVAINKYSKLNSKDIPAAISPCTVNKSD